MYLVTKFGYMFLWIITIFGYMFLVDHHHFWLYVSCGSSPFLAICFLWIITIFGYFTKLMTQNAVTHNTFVKWSVESIIHLGKLLSHVCNGPVPVACATSFV
jgi:hypothetical protein